ncbi:endonuclease/exonuclease/phosphatase family protein [Leifsonia sp. Leaf264]|uniref:endonuclease/exonuclease/phosphatase family protein n=1 Tax=Leifsonia sp. Leaf264 TaxID=1736314 RepID=UPI0006F8E199|nr:endonuclease/exonuclease/phosphatase family protein [Leifsonia sp. Leaf264]KQO98219.1 hypothetical protein ASF30_09160 [Leifsonia sp. Leaf264]
MPETFRLASLNILHGEDTIDQRITLAIEELHRLQPDALLLQEVEERQPDTLRRIADALGYHGLIHNFGLHTEGFHSGTAILSRTPFDKVTELEQVGRQPGQMFNNPPITAGTVDKLGWKINLISAHLAWGTYAETIRLRQARIIDRHARDLVEAEPGTLVLLGGDFNALPDGAVNSYLSGRSVVDGESTLWVDAFDMAGHPSSAITSRTDNETAWATARLFGVPHPEMMPGRRIDYLKAHGYVFGRTGHPIGFGRWGTTETEDGIGVSDHYGIWADFLLG